MQEDTINAFGMILMIIYTVTILFLFQTKPMRSIRWAMRIPLAIGGLVLSFVFSAPVISSRCGNMPVGGYQLLITAICILCMFLFINRKGVLLFSCALILYSGLKLEVDFINMARTSDSYIAIDSTSKTPMAKGCTNKDETGEIPALVPEKLWHTWFTGIYRGKK